MNKDAALEHRRLTQYRILVSERIAMRIADCKPVTAELAAADGSFTAIVGQLDRLNQNNRIYPATEWQRNVERINSSTALMLGAVDHAGVAEGGNLRTSPVVWERLQIRADGLVEGQFRS